MIMVLIPNLFSRALVLATLISLVIATLINPDQPPSADQVLTDVTASHLGIVLGLMQRREIFPNPSGDMTGPDYRARIERDNEEVE
jgi:hypothetical protein